MNAEQALVVELTRRIVGADGVRGIFPESVVAAAVATLVRSDRSSATGLVEVRRRGGETVVTARLAVDAASPSAAIVTAVHAAVRQVLGDASFRLRLEIAHLD